MTGPGDVLALDDVRAAAARLAGVAHRTPVVTSRLLDAQVGAQVLLKAENLQRAGSFKFRGAYNRLARLDPAERHRGVVAFSSGNHAQAVALAGSLLGIPTTIVMPTDAPASKRAATQAYGARVVPYDRDVEDREEVAARVAAELRPAATVPPYDDPAVMAGQGTALLELIEDEGPPDLVLTPLGGGGLLSGSATVVRALAPDARIVGVETVGAEDWVLSRAAGHPVTIAPPTTVADGIRTLSPGRLTWPVVSALVDDVVAVPDAAVLDAVRLVSGRLRLVVEPTGAVALAALLTGLVTVRPGERVAVVLSGGNVDPAALGRILLAGHS